MKKFYFFLIALFYVFNSFAQNTLELFVTGKINRERWMDNIFEHVDKCLILSGLLEEYGVQPVSLKTFNLLLTERNYVNARAWIYVFAPVYSAKIYGTNTLPAPEANYITFNSEALANVDANLVYIVALNYSSNRPNAVSNIYSP